MTYQFFNCNYESVLEKLNNGPDILTAKDLVDYGLFKETGRCYELVRIKKLPVHMRSRANMWFHKNNIIYYVTELLGRTGKCKF